MIGSTRAIRVFARAQPTDLRNGFDGLYGIVRSEVVPPPSLDNLMAVATTALNDPEAVLLPHEYAAYGVRPTTNHCSRTRSSRASSTTRPGSGRRACTPS